MSRKTPGVYIVEEDPDPVTEQALAKQRAMGSEYEVIGAMGDSPDLLNIGDKITIESVDSDVDGAARLARSRRVAYAARIVEASQRSHLFSGPFEQLSSSQRQKYLRLGEIAVSRLEKDEKNHE